MWVLEPAAALAMPELPKLGNATACIQSPVRYGATALDYQPLKFIERARFCCGPRGGRGVGSFTGFHDKKELQMKTPVHGLLALLACLPLWAYAGPVDINTADAETLSAELDGVGLEKAKAIVEYRQKYGPFKSPDDLSLVKGIGERTVEANRENIKVSSTAKK